MKKMMIIPVVLMMLVAGCAWLDKNVGNNNGSFDPVVSLTWLDANGSPYRLAYDDSGFEIEGTFSGPKGTIWKVTKGEGVTITDPKSGATLVIAKENIDE